MKTKLLKLTRKKVFLEDLGDGRYKLHFLFRRKDRFEVFSSIDKEKNIREAESALVKSRIIYAKTMAINRVSKLFN